MIDPDLRKSRLRLLAWLSPQFPIGGFAWSGGLERAIHDGQITDKESLAAWLEALMDAGSLRNDLVFLAQAYHCQNDQAALTDLSELAIALAGSQERHAEILALGAAFRQAAGAWPDDVLARLGEAPTWTIALGAMAGANGLDRLELLSAFLSAFIAQMTSVSIRCGIIGQTDSLALIAAFEDKILALAEWADQAGLDDLGSAAMLAEIASMNHEIQYSRLFRS